MNTAQHIAPLRKTTQPKAVAPITQDLADMARLSIKEVVPLVGVCAAQLRKMIREGRFPQPDYRDGPRCVRWSAGLVKRWLAQTTTQGAK